MKGWQLTLDYINKLCFDNPHESWLFDTQRAEANKIIKECYSWLHHKADGKKLDIEQARLFPIGDLMQGAQEVITGQQRSKYKCPLHSEKSSSFVWYKNNNSYYCFGCGKGGDVINLYMQLHRTDFVSAIKALT